VEVRQIRMEESRIFEQGKAEDEGQYSKCAPNTSLAYDNRPLINRLWGRRNLYIESTRKAGLELIARSLGLRIGPSRDPTLSCVDIRGRWILGGR
jgi:hypothetical protein